jgi:repressor of nif and glnA expression
MEKLYLADYRNGIAIVNKSIVYGNHDEIKDIILKVLEFGLGVGDKINIVEEKNYTRVETLCGVTFDSWLLSYGILPLPKYGGIVKFEDYEPVQFEGVINYKSTSVDPLEAFIMQGKTDVLGVVENGEGYVPANFRVIPKEAKDKFEKLLNKDTLNCVLSYGEENVLGLNVEEDEIGIALVGGITPVAALVEKGYYVELNAASTIKKVSFMEKVSKRKILPQKKKGGIKIKSVLSKMFNNMAKITYDINKEDGDVIVNVGYVEEKYYADVIEILKEAYKRGLGISNRFGIKEEDGLIKISTICASTLDGIFSNYGIPIIPRYGGVLEIGEEKDRFIDIISYEGSSLDPHEVFFNKVDCETSILAGFREIPMCAREDLVDLVRTLGWSGIKEIGRPNNEVYGVDVEKDMCGVVTIGGMNPLAMIKEHEIPIKIKALHEIVKFSELVEYDEI